MVYSKLLLKNSHFDFVVEDLKSFPDYLTLSNRDRKIHRKTYGTFNMLVKKILDPGLGNFFVQDLTLQGITQLWKGLI